MTFSMTDIHVNDVSKPKPRISYQDDKAVLASVIDFDIELVFQFNAQQSGYPYIQETGSGRLGVTNFSLSIGMSPYVQTACPYHMGVNFSQEIASIDGIQIQLESDNSFIYNSILQLFTQVLTDYMNAMLKDIMSSMLKELASEYLID